MAFWLGLLALAATVLFVLPQPAPTPGRAFIGRGSHRWAVPATTHAQEPDRRGLEGQTLCLILRLDPLPGRVPNDAVRPPEPAQGTWTGCCAVADPVRQRRSGAGHAGLAQDLPGIIWRAHRRADRHGRGGRSGGQGVPGVLPYGATGRRSYTMEHIATVYLMTGKGRFFSAPDYNESCDASLSSSGYSLRVEGRPHPRDAEAEEDRGYRVRRPPPEDHHWYGAVRWRCRDLLLQLENLGSTGAVMGDVTGDDCRPPGLLAPVIDDYIDGRCSGSRYRPSLTDFSWRSVPIEPCSPLLADPDTICAIY